MTIYDADDVPNLTMLEMKRLTETLTTPVGADIPEAFLGVSSLLAFTARWSAWYLEAKHYTIFLCIGAGKYRYRHIDHWSSGGLLVLC